MSPNATLPHTKAASPNGFVQRSRQALGRLQPPALLQRWFNSLRPRERMLLGALAWLLPLLAIAALFDWVLTEQARLERHLPAAQATLEKMREDAAELERLLALKPPATVPPPQLAEAVSAAARARGLETEASATPDGLTVTGSGGLAAQVDWLAALQADLGLRPRQLRLQDDQRFEVLLAPASDEGGR
ncbi:hypothetical protein GPA19_02060 [Azoarcus indigens]|uniref:Type II secretory pathway component PulM n=1 Tax=Azoarcus indigens TaxID=29545 RepID=A0A4R6EDJ9_9RHOO|nr:type II secretion system protein GspM [Azoarcus indigens]NMG63737.1 hypothetical protein [Azoarcus indigens]TDN56271.1 type II secretory pathway component PulM [Azoarcus indigens]